VECTILFNHRPSHLRGKDGLTIDQNTASVREIATDAELLKVLLNGGTW
jgi:hypothetical protein